MTSLCYDSYMDTGFRRISMIVFTAHIYDFLLSIMVVLSIYIHNIFVWLKKLSVTCCGCRCIRHVHFYGVVPIVWFPKEPNKSKT